MIGRKLAHYEVLPGQLFQVRFRLGEAYYSVEFDPAPGRPGQIKKIVDQLPNVQSFEYLSDGRILGLMRDEDEKPTDEIGLRFGFGDEIARKVTAQRR